MESTNEKHTMLTVVCIDNVTFCIMSMVEKQFVVSSRRRYRQDAIHRKDACNDYLPYSFRRLVTSLELIPRATRNTMVATVCVYEQLAIHVTRMSHAAKVTD